MESSHENPMHENVQKMPPHSLEESSQGSIRRFIDKLLATYAKDDELIRSVVLCRLRLQGIHPDKYTLDTPDEHITLNKLIKIEQDLAKIFV